MSFEQRHLIPIPGRENNSRTISNWPSIDAQINDV